MAHVDDRAGVGMIINGRTLEQVKAAIDSIGPTSSVVKLKPVLTSTLKLTGYVGVYGTHYRTKHLNGNLHPWQPCYHFYQDLMNALVAQGKGTSLPYPTITLHKHLLKPYNSASKANLALYKKGLSCSHEPASPFAASGNTPAQPPPLPKPTGEPLSFPALVGAPVEIGETNHAVNVKNKVRPIHAVCASMYVLEYCKVGAARIPSWVSPEVPDHLQMRALHAVQWRNRVTRYAEHFAHTFARNLFDYLTMAAFGEARYKQGEFYTFDAPGMKGGGRIGAYQVALKYDPRDLLPKLEHVFDAYPWGKGGYGGKKWAKMARFAGEFFKPMYRDYPVVFADHCVDLAHNGGLAFDKGYILGNPPSESSYMAMLNSKRIPDGEPGSFLTQTALQHPLLPQTYAFYQEGVGLGLVPRFASEFKVVPDVDVPTLNWGTEHLTLYAGPHHQTAEAVFSLPTTTTEEIPIETYPERA